jgi:hypothetical protein
LIKSHTRKAKSPASTHHAPSASYFQSSIGTTKGSQRQVMLSTVLARKAGLPSVAIVRNLQRDKNRKSVV